MKKIFLENSRQIINRIRQCFSYVLFKKKFIIFSAITLILAIAFLCLGTGQSHDYEKIASGGGSYNEGVIGELESLNPLFAKTEAEKTASKLLYRALFDYDRENKITLDLASNYKKDNNSREFEVTIKDELFWSDGEKIVTDDVIETIRIIRDDQYFGPFRGSFDDVDIEKINQNRLRFKLAKSDPLFINRLTIPIMPHNYLKDMSPDKLLLNTISRNPVSSGPYVFKEYNISSNYHQITLNPNPQYKGLINSSEEGPYIENLMFTIYPNYQSVLSDFQKGKIDGMSYIQPSDLLDLELNNNNNVRELNLSQMTVVFFNNQDGRLKDKKLREAFVLAVDRKSIVSEILGDRADLIDGPLLEKSKKNDFNPKRAKKIYADLKLENNQFSLITSRDQTKLDVANALSDFWSELGVEIEINSFCENELKELIEGKKDYDILLSGYNLGVTSNLYPFWHSSQRDGGLNLANYRNQDVDFYLEQSVEADNLEEREDYINLASKQIREDGPALFLYQPRYLHLIGEKIKGFDTEIRITNSEDRFDSVENWFIKEKRRLK